MPRVCRLRGLGRPSRLSLTFWRRGHRDYVAETAAPLWVSDLTGTAALAHELPDSLDGASTCAIDLLPQLHFSDPEAIAHHP